MIEVEPNNVKKFSKIASTCIDTAKLLPKVNLPKASKFFDRLPEIAKKGLEHFSRDISQEVHTTGPMNPLEIFPFGIFSATLDCYNRTENVLKNTGSNYSGTICAATYLSLNLRDRVFEVFEISPDKQIIVTNSGSTEIIIDFNFNKEINGKNIEIFLGPAELYPSKSKKPYPFKVAIKEALCGKIELSILSNKRNERFSLDKIISAIDKKEEQSAIKQILKLSLGSPYWKEFTDLFKKEDSSMFYLVNLINRSKDSFIAARALTSLIHLMPETAAVKGWCQGNSLHLVINSLKPQDLQRYCKAVNSRNSPITLRELASKPDRDGLTPLMRAYVTKNSHGIDLLSPFAGTEVDNYGYSVKDYRRVFLK